MLLNEGLLTPSLDRKKPLQSLYCSGLLRTIDVCIRVCCQTRCPDCKSVFVSGIHHKVSVAKDCEFLPDKHTEGNKRVDGQISTTSSSWVLLLNSNLEFFRSTEPSMGIPHTPGNVFSFPVIFCGRVKQLYINTNKLFRFKIEYI